MITRPNARAPHAPADPHAALPFPVLCSGHRATAVGVPTPRPGRRRSASHLRPPPPEARGARIAL